VLRIETQSDATHTSIRLIGRIRSDDIDGLRQHIDSAERRIVLDLSEVTLVDLDVIRFLIACEDAALELRHCSLYIREWMYRERVEGS
jgi:anti-anti-sigma regulatory factor